MKQIQRGFTLIELVVVIVILGILSAVALPKFVDLNKDARISVMKATEGSMRAANAMIYAKAGVAGEMKATGSVKIDGGATIINTVYGFAENVAELKKVMDLSDEIVAGTGNMVLQHDNAATPAYCSVTYTAATDTTAPKYSLEPSGC
ncbi:hypothetical protein FACS1894158_16470 [Betaproteobacteria bacterium]|nr:hypothetical protein FACS1894158_16470 [Betaproteobacteria bacterium]